MQSKAIVDGFFIVTLLKNSDIQVDMDYFFLLDISDGDVNRN